MEVEALLHKHILGSMYRFDVCCLSSIVLRKQVSLNDSDDTGSLIDEDDESTEDHQASRSYSDSNDDNF